MDDGGPPKRLSFPLLLVFACLAGATYGVLNDQISYTVSPDYYHAFKFRQFAIPDTLPPRLGAAIVGVRASWWMGLIIGLPVLGAGALLVRDRRAYVRAGLLAVGVVLVTTFTAALMGLLLETAFPTQGSHWWVPEGVDRAAFLRAGAMHNAAYLGGAFGLLLAFIPIWSARRVGRDQPGG